MWKKIVVMSLVAIGAVSCSYNKPIARDHDTRVERNDAPVAPRARPMGEGEMETPGIDAAPDPMSPDIPVAPDSGSNEAAPGAPTTPSSSDDDILSPASEPRTPPDSIAPSPSDSSDATDAINDDSDDGDDSDDSDNDKADANKKKKSAPGRGEGEPESDDADGEGDPFPGDKEIDGETN